MLGRAVPLPSRRWLAALCLLAALALAWFSYGRYLLALFSYSLPSFTLSWSQLSLPELQVSGAVQPAVLTIDKLKLQAPIVRDVPVDDQQKYNAALEQGVALAAGSAPLESRSGNSFIFGHSSKFAIKASPYDTVFALLPKLTEGDTIKLTSGGQTATYAVVLSKQIAPSEVQYLAADGERRLTLVTCWPAGTQFRRWVVQAVPKQGQRASSLLHF